MSDVVLSALIATMGGVITAAITALVPLFIEIRKQKCESEQRELERKARQERVSAQGQRGKKHPKEEQLNGESPTSIVKSEEKPRIAWRKTGMYGILVAGILFLGRTIYISVSQSPPPTPSAIFLADAKVEFKITVGDDTQLVPAYGKLTLRQGDQINIETIVTDANGNSYPDNLDITYFFTSGEKFSGKIAPYTAKPSSDLITVQIKNRITGETISRTLLIHVN